MDFKSLITGIILCCIFIILGHDCWDWFYPFAAIGLLYVGYKQDNIKEGIIMGVVCAIPIVLLSFWGYLGSFSGFFITIEGIVCLAIIILLVGAFVGFVGAWAKRDRVKALEEYNKKGKKKK